MVGRPGFEPGTNNLKGCCSTIELSTHANTSRQLFLPARAKQELFVLNWKFTDWGGRFGVVDQQKRGATMSETSRCRRSAQKDPFRCRLLILHGICETVPLAS